MEPLIYYPTFEPPNESWLKFSLLYLENFRPIIPNNRHHNLSDNYRRIINETDLINPLNPSYDLGHRASLNAIEEVEKIYNNVHQRSFLFDNSNLIRKWENPDNWNFQIYQEKFSMNWGRLLHRKKHWRSKS